MKGKTILIDNKEILSNGAYIVKLLYNKKTGEIEREPKDLYIKHTNNDIAINFEAENNELIEIRGCDVNCIYLVYNDRLVFMCSNLDKRFVKEEDLKRHLKNEDRMLIDFEEEIESYRIKRGL